MTPHRILQMNAASTALCAIAMLATRGTLHRLFGLQTPLFLDVLAIALLAYAGVLVASTRRPWITREMLLAFTAGDVLWVAGSALVLLLYWGQFTPLARVLVVATAAIVEVFATLQWRAAGRATAMRTA